MSKVVIGLLVAALAMPPLMVDKALRPETVPVKVEKVMPTPPPVPAKAKASEKHYSSSSQFCIKVREAVSTFGVDKVREGANARKMPKAKQDKILADCKAK